MARITWTGPATTRWQPIQTGPNVRLNVKPDAYTSFQGIIGLRGRHNFSDSLFVTAHAAYRHKFADRAVTTRNAFAVAPDARFVTKGYEQAPARGEFGAGFGWAPNTRLSLSMSYDCRLMERQTSHAVMATVRIKF